jgi:hypothetical protein
MAYERKNFARFAGPRSTCGMAAYMSIELRVAKKVCIRYTVQSFVRVR